MTLKVNITKGNYRGDFVSGIFDLMQGYKIGAKGGFVTIRNPNPKAGTPPVQRVLVQEGDFKVIDAEGQELSSNTVVDTTTGGAAAPGADSNGAVSAYEKTFIESETEDDAMSRIRDTFSMMDRIVDSVARGVIRGLVVTGPPGIGKSFGVEKQLAAANMFRTIREGRQNYEIVTGGVSSIGLYEKLYAYRGSDKTIVFDDCDGVFFDEECLSLLKGALNSGDKRRISWNKQSRVLESNDIPSSFEFEGGIIFLSNIDFERTIARGSRISSHLQAIMSRCHYMDLEISTQRDQLLRIKQVMNDGMLDSYEFTSLQQDDIWNFVNNNADYLREVSLRMVKKIADFVKSDPNDWLSMAEATVLQREAKFKRLLAKKREAEKHDVELIGM